MLQFEGVCAMCRVGAQVPQPEAARRTESSRLLSTDDGLIGIAEGTLL